MKICIGMLLVVFSCLAYSNGDLSADAMYIILSMSMLTVGFGLDEIAKK